MRKYTQRELKRLVKSGCAIDITNAKGYDAIPEKYIQIGYAVGTYGTIGKLFEGYSGKKYAIIKRTSALFMF